MHAASCSQDLTRGHENGEQERCGQQRSAAQKVIHAAEPRKGSAMGLPHALRDRGALDGMSGVELRCSEVASTPYLHPPIHHQPSIQQSGRQVRRGRVAPFVVPLGAPRRSYLCMLLVVSCIRCPIKDTTLVIVTPWSTAATPLRRHRASAQRPQRSLR
jgi:hypothetical protein